MQPCCTPSNHTGTSSSTAVHSELSVIFKWNPNYKPGKKRKGGGFGKGSKRKKLPQWTHTWICLGNGGEQYSPDAETKAALQLAGLGEKRFPLLLDFEADEIHDELIAQFPKLEKCGGYQLLRLAPEE